MADEASISNIEPFKSLNEATYSSFHRTLVIITSLGAFTDLYTTLSLGASTFSIIPFLFHGNLSEFAFAGSIFFIGAIIGALSIGIVTDFLGRKLTFMLDLLSIGILAILSALVTSPVELYIIRFLLGIATGGDYPAAMTLVAEFMPRIYRGRGMTYLWVSFTLGGVLAYIVGYILYNLIGATPLEWRIMLGSVAIPAFIGVLLRSTLPESPRWAILKEKYNKANEATKKAIGKIFSIDELKHARTQIYLFEKSPRSEKVAIGRLLKYIVPIVIAAFCFNLIPGALATLNPSILSALGITKSGTLLYSAFFLGIQTIATYIVAMSVERVKRINFLILGGILESLASFMVILIYHTPILLLVLFTIISYGAFTVIPVVRNFGSELFPTKIRGTTSGIVMAGDRLASAAGIFITPLLFEGHNVLRLFSAYGILGIIGIGVILPLYSILHIENLSLEDIQKKIIK